MKLQFFQNAFKVNLLKEGFETPGFKVQKEKVSLLLCTNITGNEKLLPLVIGRYKSPRCLKTMKELPCYYESNSASWMTRVIFKKWLTIGIKH